MGSGAGKLNNTERKLKAVAAFKGPAVKDENKTTNPSTMPSVQKPKVETDLSVFTDQTRNCFKTMRHDIKYFNQSDVIWGKDGKVKVTDEMADICSTMVNHNYKLMKTESVQKLKVAAMAYAGKIYVETGVLGNIVKLLCDLWDQGFDSGDEYKDGLVLTSFRTHLSVFQTLTYYDSVVSVALCEVGFLRGMAKWLGDLQKKHFSRTGTAAEEKLVIAFLANSNNCSSHGALTKAYFDDLNYVDVMVPYLKTPNNYFLTSCIICLAYILDDSRNDIFSSDLSHIKYVVNLLAATLDPKARSYGWTAGTLSKGIAKLAVNDDNKKIMVDAGILPHLVKMAKLKDKDDVLAAVQLMWALSFHPENKKRMTADKDIVNTLESLAKSEDKRLGMEAEGCMWTLGLVKLGPATPDFSNAATADLVLSKLKKATSNENNEEEEEEATQKTDSNGSHVMISYNWEDQHMIIKIKQQLNEIGFRVWLDVEQMGGSTLQAMASAVEKAVVILVCMSQKYKDSPNCRAEAEYAFQQRKHIIPLLMQKRYRADGWLGMIAGTKLFYDFSGKYSFESRLDGLLKALSDKGKAACKDGTAIQQISTTVTTVQPRAATEKKKARCSTWTTNEVQTWVKGMNLKSDTKFNEVDGDQLCFLQEMREMAPEFYFGYLERHLKLTVLKDFMIFDRSLSQLTK